MTGNLSYFQDLLASIMAHGSRLPIPGLDRSAAEENDLPKLAQLTVETRGEASALVHAEQLLQQFEASTDEQQLAFFQVLLDDYGIDIDAVTQLADAYSIERTTDNLAHLLQSAEPRRQELFRRMNSTPRGTIHLVQMRMELLKMIRQHPALKPVDMDFQHLLRSWFNRSFLVMRPINWSTPANILEKIIAYEAVHQIHNWRELRLRLEPTDRRCFAFFHPAMQDEPLIFVEVALTAAIPGSIQQVLSSTRTQLAADKATTAVFYSISNCQSGLSGISFGSFLIKQVAHKLKNELPGLKNFVTLSPVPGFMKWLKREAEADNGKYAPVPELLSDASWLEDTEKTTQLAERLPALAAEYLVRAKQTNGQPLDPVARFHLGNGAMLKHIHFQGDTSAKGLANAGSIMVNYSYDLAKAEQNHEAYAENHQVLASKAVAKLLRDL